MKIKIIIQNYDIYNLNLNEFNHISIRAIKESISLYYIKIFLLFSLRGIRSFIDAINSYSKDGMSFELIEITIDHENNLVYISESYDPHDPKFDAPEINTLIEADNFIALCKMGLVDYTVMTKDNFTHLLFAWDKIIDTLPPFALLYQDDQGWYDVLPFDTQETMEQFIADHTAIEDIHE